MAASILDELHATRERLWQRGGGTVHGLCEYLRECRRRADARGVQWIESEEEREAIGAEVRARLAREAGGAMCVGEETGGYRAEEAHAEARRDGGAEGGRAHAEAQRRGEGGQTNFAHTCAESGGRGS